MKKQTIIMDFSGIYREESFFENREEVCWLDCRDVSGVNGYCSDDAQKKSENEYRNIAMKVFIFWIPAIIII